MFGKAGLTVTLTLFAFFLHRRRGVFTEET